MKIVQPSAELVWITSNALEIVEAAGRTAYKSEGKIEKGSAERFVKMLLSRGHESVIEHASASIRIVCDRGLTHELVRHRLVSYTQESTRYCSYADEKFEGEISVILPSDIRPGTVEYAYWHKAVSAAEENYMNMLKVCKLSPQIARSVLPTCLKTEIVCTANLQEWRHILKLRTSKAAHPQMRELMLKVLNILWNECPVLFEDIIVGFTRKGDCDA